MELREWLIILGLILMAIIVVDGVRRLQRQRQSSRLGAGRDAQHEKSDDDIARETAWELPNGGARVVKEATVQPPARQSSAFERQGLKTRISEGNIAVATAANTLDTTATEAVQPAFSTTMTNADAEFSPEREHLGAAAEADTMTDAATTEKPAPSPAKDNDESINDETPLDAQDRESAFAEEVDAEHIEQDNEIATRQEKNDEELAPEPFDMPEEEVVDDPRYEGLSEILWRRPLDAFAHMRELWAERRVRKAQAREEARIRRLETRARRAEEKEQRRLEKEAAEQQAREKALALQAAQQEERRARAETVSRYHDDPLAPLDDEDPLFAPSRHRRSADEDVEKAYGENYEEDTEAYYQHGYDDDQAGSYADDEPAWEDDASGFSRHPDIERAYRHLVNGSQARETLASASEVIAIAVMARQGETLDGITLLKLMLACGLRYCSTTRVFHRFETDDDQSPLQFSVIDTLKPGEFSLEEMEEFTTKGVWLLMPMPGANELSTAFEAMYETARAIARYLEGELRDENQCVITSQTVEFSRQRVQEFERRAKLYHASH